MAVQYQNKRNILDKKEQKKAETKENFKIQITSQQFTAIHCCTYNYNYNIGDNKHYVWTIKIKSFSNKHSNATH